MMGGGLAEPQVIVPAQIAAVYNVQAGAILAAALAPGNTTITVDDADAFVDEGGAIALESAEEVFVPANVTDGTPAYTDRPQTPGVVYTKVDRDTNVLTLAAAWDAAFPSFAAGDSVWVDPPSVELRADVTLDGDPAQVISATIPYALAQAIPQGLRPEGEGEWIEVAQTEKGEAWQIVDVLGEAPIFDPTTESDPASADLTLDSLAVDVLESPSVAKRNPYPLTLYVAPNDPTANDENGGEALSPLIDAFNRTNATAFGTSDSGHLWTTAQNQGNILETDGANARIRLNGSAQNSVVRSAFAPLDVEILTSLNFTGVPTGGSANFGVAARASDGQNLVHASIQLNPTAIDLNVEKRVGGTWTNIGAVTNVFTGLTDANVGTFDYFIRAQWQTNPEGGTDIRAKLWRSDQAEPDLWMLEVNDLTAILQSPNAVAISARSGGSYADPGTFPICAWRSITAQCIGGDSLPVDVTAGGVGPLATIAAALAQVGEVNDAAVIILLGAGVIEEDVYVTGLTGGGSLTIDGAGLAVVNGTMRFQGIAHYVLLRSFTMQDTGSPGPSGTIHVQNGTFVECNDVKIQTNSYRASNIYFQFGAIGRVIGCQLNGTTNRCVYSANGSLVYCSDNLGTGAGTSYSAVAGIIFINGSKPTDAIATSLGGQSFGSTSSNGAGTAPTPQPTKKSDTITANGTKTWRPAWGWKSGDETIQGEYAGSGGLSRGCAFYGTKLRKSGKTADSGKVYVRRLAQYGGSGKSDVFLACHNEQSQPGGSPTITLGPTRVGALAWNEGAWFTIPKSWVQALMTGGSRGLMVYHGSASPYLALAGRGNGSSNWQVKITYH